MHKLEQTAAVNDGKTALHMLLSKNPNLQFEGGSPLWKAMWKAWEQLRTVLEWSPPAQRNDAACLPIQGFQHVWSVDRSKTIDRSKRIKQAAGKGLVSLSDLWSWENDCWKSPRILRSEFSVPRTAAKMLVASLAEDLIPAVKEAMRHPVSLAVGDWVSDGRCLSDGTAWNQTKAFRVQKVSHDSLQVQEFKVISPEGQICKTDNTCTIPAGLMVPITVLVKEAKDR